MIGQQLKGKKLGPGGYSNEPIGSLLWQIKPTNNMAVNTKDKCIPAQYLYRTDELTQSFAYDKNTGAITITYSAGGMPYFTATANANGLNVITLPCADPTRSYTLQLGKCTTQEKYPNAVACTLYGSCPGPTCSQ